MTSASYLLCDASCIPKSTEHSQMLTVLVNNNNRRRSPVWIHEVEQLEIENSCKKNKHRQTSKSMSNRNSPLALLIKPHITRFMHNHHPRPRHPCELANIKLAAGEAANLVWFFKLQRRDRFFLERDLALKKTEEATVYWVLQFRGDGPQCFLYFSAISSQILWGNCILQKVLTGQSLIDSAEKLLKWNPEEGNINFFPVYSILQTIDL